MVSHLGLCDPRMELKNETMSRLLDMRGSLDCHLILRVWIAVCLGPPMSSVNSNAKIECNTTRTNTNIESRCWSSCREHADRRRQFLIRAGNQWIRVFTLAMDTMVETWKGREGIIVERRWRWRYSEMIGAHTKWASSRLSACLPRLGRVQGDEEETRRRRGRREIASIFPRADSAVES